MITASAPAKAILLGEHAVVYGQPAIAVPVSGLRAYASVQPNESDAGLHIASGSLDIPVDVDAEKVDHALALTARLVLKALGTPPPNVTIAIRSNIPIASGLGSGAAVSTALARALCAAVGMSLDDASLNSLIYEVEKIHHGTPSGIDNTVIVYERPVYFVRGKPIETLTIGKPFTLLIGDTGKSASTREAVAGVRAMYDANPVEVQKIFDDIGQLVRGARDEIEGAHPLMLRLSMRNNQMRLRQLGVSSPELDTLIEAAEKAGAKAAKLSGGGRGGNMIALVTPETREKVEAALYQAGAVHVYTTEVHP
jgi:mevalonate kinase